jgi:hypothetical protein
MARREIQSDSVSCSSVPKVLVPLRQLLLATLVLSSSVAALAQDGVVERQAKGQSGRDIRIAVFASIKPDCTAGQLPTVRLKEPAAHGTVTVKQGRIRTTNFKQCLAVEVPAFVAFYRSSPGFSGQDSVLVEVVSADGKTQLQRFTVTIEKPQVGQGI